MHIFTYQNDIVFLGSQHQKLFQLSNIYKYNFTKYNTKLRLTDRIQADFGTIFLSESFQKFWINNKFELTVASSKHLEMNSILERTFQSLALIKNSLIIQARVEATFTNFALQYACEIFSIIQVQTLQKIIV